MNLNGIVNWEAISKLNPMNFSKDSEKQQEQFWGQFSKMYDGMSRLEEKFTQKQVDQMILDPEDTVVDIGCGPGRLTIPIAKKVKSVTAVDVSSNMLEECMKNAKREGVSNIRTIKTNWLERENETKIGMHDIALASRSVGFSDIIRLNNIARKYAFIMCFASGPSLREIQLDFLKGIEELTQLPKKSEDFNPRIFGYNVNFNILYDLGFDPNVVILDDGFERDYSSREEAYEDLRFVGNIPEKYEEIYRSNVDKYLVEKEDKSFKLIRTTKTYVMWWETKHIDLG